MNARIVRIASASVEVQLVSRVSRKRAYVVWDKAATIRFKRPGRSRLLARFEISEDETTAIRRELDTCDSVDRIYEVSLVDGEGVVHATVEKVIYIGRKDRARSK